MTDELIAKYCRFAVGKRPDLISWPTRIADERFGGKDAGLELLVSLGHQISELQRRLWAGKKHKVLIVLQGMDTSGKDGTIRHVFRFTNPNGVNVAAFDKPTRRELSYDFLWRVHQRVPHDGEMVIFDRSHYEDIVAVRVNNLKPEKIWSKRYKHIVDFEDMLLDEGTLILKFFLHISRDEQRKRLQARIDDPEKHWKFDPSDVVARDHWDDYMVAYMDVLERCHTPGSRWHIIPSDKKWQRNVLVAFVVRQALQDLNMEFPASSMDLSAVKLED